MRLNLALQFNPGDAPQIFAENFCLDLQLVIVAGVLVLTSPAAFVIRTRGRNPVRRRLHDPRDVRPREPRFFLGERGVDFFPAKNERRKDGFAPSSVVSRKTSQPVPTVDQLFNV